MSAKELVEALTPLANKLGQGAEAIYQAYYHQAIINGFQDLLWAAALIGFVAFIAVKVIPGMRRRHEEDDNDGIALGLTVVGLVLLSFIAMLCITDAITSLANPQYKAISSIISEVKQ